MIPVDRDNPLEAIDLLNEAAQAGSSLIIFPEGTRNPERLPGPFKSGLFHLANRFPNAELVPVYLENLHRIMPKGTFFPVPLICTVRFGSIDDLRSHLEKTDRAP